MPNPARHIQKGLPYLTNHSWLVSARVTSTPSSPKTPPRPLRTPQDLPKSPQDFPKTSLRPPWEPLLDFPSTHPHSSRKDFSNPGWHIQKGLPHFTDHSCVIVCTRGHGYSAGLRVGNTPSLYSISKRPKNKGCLSVWVAVLGPSWASLVPDVVIQRLVFCCQVLF